MVIFSKVDATGYAYDVTFMKKVTVFQKTSVLQISGTKQTI